mgnify:CR=1 FL=1
MLPVDPTDIDPDDIGKKQTTLRMEHKEAVEHVRETCEEVGFGIPVEFSPSELLNEKVDADRDPYYVLGACNPAMANRALDATRKMGGLFPCNVVVWQEEPGVQRVYQVSIMKIARLVGVAPDDDEWQGIVESTGEMTEELFERL